MGGCGVTLGHGQIISLGQVFLGGKLVWTKLFDLRNACKVNIATASMVVVLSGAQEAPALQSVISLMVLSGQDWSGSRIVICNVITWSEKMGGQDWWGLSTQRGGSSPSSLLLHFQEWIHFAVAPPWCLATNSTPWAIIFCWSLCRDIMKSLGIWPGWGFQITQLQSERFIKVGMILEW